MKEQEDILKYVLILSTFYEKAVTAHPKRQVLKRSIQNWKQDIHGYFTKSEEQQTKTVRTQVTNFDRKSSPNKYPTAKSIQSTLPEFSVFSLKEDNDFFKVFSYQYLVTITASSTSQQIEALQEQISKASHLLEGTSFAQSVTLRKISLLINYLAKISESNSVQEIRGKIEIVYNQDKNILAKIVKVLALSRKPSIANLISETPPSQTAMKALCEVLSTRLTLFEVGDNQSKKVLGKGPLELAMAVEKGTNAFHCLFRKTSPSVSRSNSKKTNEVIDKGHLFTDLLDKIHSNSEKLSTLKSLSKSEAIQDINIKERLKKMTNRKI